MAGVTIDDVTKVYESAGGDVVAVENLDLSIDDGQFLVLVGPSGCGKSTTLRMVAGLETITDGEISIGQTVVNGMEPRERDIAMVFQNYALYPHMTVRENMAFGLKYSSDLPKEEVNERVKEVAEMMGIDDLLDDKPGQMSGGQRQRVALGRAIVREPKAFLFDEPLSNLDAKLRTKMRTEITQLQNELGVTSIYVTHDQAEAMTMGDIVAVMNEGRLQQASSPNDVYNHPANRFVAGFIGSPAMNFLQTILKNQGDSRLVVSERASDVFYPLADAVYESIDADVGDRLTVGIRPEDLQVVQDAADRDGRKLIDATVEVVEPMGSDNFLTLDIGSEEHWVARVDSSYNPEVGAQVAVTFDESVLHLFDADGETLKSQGMNSESFHETEPLAP